MKSNIFAAIVAVCCFAGAAHASGVKIYTCDSADQQVVVHMMPKKLQAVVHQADAERAFYDLACTEGTNDVLWTCHDAEGRNFELNRSLNATYAMPGKVIELVCHVSRIG